MLHTITASKSKTFLAFCFCFLIGNATAALGFLDGFIFDVVPYQTWIISPQLFLIFILKQKTIRFFCIASLCFIFGITLYQSSFPREETHIVYKAGEKVTLDIVVSRESDVRLDGVRYIARVEKDYTGNVYFKYPLYPRFSYGDHLVVSCNIEKPEPIEEFRYDMYLARFGVFAICQNPFVSSVEKGTGFSFFRSLFAFKDTVAIHVNQLWPEPHASFVAGILYGYRGGLGTLNEAFSRTGTTHVIAVSGFNISIVITVFSSLLIYLLVPRKKAFWIAVLGVAIFVLFTGASASVVRAGIMGILSLTAKQVGRSSTIFNVMVFTAVLMVIENPFVLIWDAGFQLSFLSTLGLVYVSPILETYTTWVPDKFGLRDSFTSTLSATLSTLPLILSQFGRLSIVSLPVNILILWIIPWLMAFSFASVVLSFLLFPAGQFIAWLTWIGLEYVVIVVRWFSALPFAAVDLTIPTWVMVGTYVVGVIWIVRRE